MDFLKVAVVLRVERGGQAAAHLADSAECNAAGRGLPRFSARRRIPAHAFGLKKYLGSTLSSSTSESVVCSLGSGQDVIDVVNPVHVASEFSTGFDRIVRTHLVRC